MSMPIHILEAREEGFQSGWRPVVDSLPRNQLRGDRAASRSRISLDWHPTPQRAAIATVVTVVGHAATISAGEWITASGEWVNDRMHGQQFKARFLRTSPPTSAEGIETYLSSGMIRGVGPVCAKNLVRVFGEQVFDVIEAAPDRLREVGGIGPVRAASILTAWAE